MSFKGHHRASRSIFLTVAMEATMTLACAGQMFLPCSIPATIWSSIIASFSTVCSSNSSRWARKRTRLFGLPKCSFMIMAAMMVFPAPTAATSNRFNTFLSHRPKQHFTASPWYGRSCTFIGRAAKTTGALSIIGAKGLSWGRGVRFPAAFLWPGGSPAGEVVLFAELQCHGSGSQLGRAAFCEEGTGQQCVARIGDEEKDPCLGAADGPQKGPATVFRVALALVGPISVQTVRQHDIIRAEIGRLERCGADDSPCGHGWPIPQTVFVPLQEVRRFQVTRHLPGVVGIAEDDGQKALTDAKLKP